jgi:hypothetical protein
LPKITEGRFAIGALFAFAFWLLVGLPFYYGHHDQPSDQCTTEESKHYGFWQKAACDPVAYFTLWLVGFTGVLAVSTIGLWWATYRTLAHAEKSNEDTLKAYVHAARAYYMWDGRTLACLLKVTNTGQTPATFFEIGATTLVGEAKRWSEIKIPDGLPRLTWVTLGAGERVSVGAPCDTEKASTDAMSVIQDADKYLALIGRVRYGDIFGNTYESEFMFFSRTIFITAGKPGKIKMSRGPSRLKTYQKIENA